VAGLQRLTGKLKRPPVDASPADGDTVASHASSAQQAKSNLLGRTKSCGQCRPPPRSCSSTAEHPDPATRTISTIQKLSSDVDFGLASCNRLCHCRVSYRLVSIEDRICPYSRRHFWELHGRPETVASSCGSQYCFINRFDGDVCQSRNLGGFEYETRCFNVYMASNESGDRTLRFNEALLVASTERSRLSRLASFVLCHQVASLPI